MLNPSFIPSHEVRFEPAHGGKADEVSVMRGGAEGGDDARRRHNAPVPEVHAAFSARWESVRARDESSAESRGVEGRCNAASESTRFATDEGIGRIVRQGVASTKCDAPGRLPEMQIIAARGGQLSAEHALQMPSLRHAVPGVDARRVPAAR
jgi:hypothetical protein